MVLLKIKKCEKNIFLEKRKVWYADCSFQKFEHYVAYQAGADGKGLRL